MKIILGAAVLALGFAAASGANAGCAQANTFGVWSAYTVGVNSSGPFWLRCTLTFDQSGKVIPAYSACTQPDDHSVGVTGNLTLTDGGMCAYTGVVNVDGVPNTITQATLTGNKQSGAGVGTFSGGGFAFNMIKTH